MIRIACVGINLFAHAAVIKKLKLNLPLCVLGAGAIHALLLAAALPMLVTLPNPSALEPAEAADPAAIAIDTGPPVSDPHSLEVDVEIVTPQGDLSAANEPAAAPVEGAQGESVGATAPAVSLDYAERVPIATPLPLRALEPLAAKPAEAPAATAVVEAADPAPTGSIPDTNTTEAPAPSSAPMAAASSPAVASGPFEAKAGKGVAGAAAVMASADPTDVPAPKLVEIEDAGPPPPLPRRKPRFSKPVASIAPAVVEKKRVAAPKAASRPAQQRVVPRSRAVAKPAPVAGRRTTNVGPPTTGSWGQLLNAPNAQPIPAGKAYGTSR